MTELGNGLSSAGKYADALPVREAELSTLRRQNAPEESILVELGNLASSYALVGRNDVALSMRRDVYSRTLKLMGEEHEETIQAANNYANILSTLEPGHLSEARSLMKKTIPVSQRVLGESHRLTILIKFNYAFALYMDTTLTLDDLREAVTLLEELAPNARRVLGSTHPLASSIEKSLEVARMRLRSPSETGEFVRLVKKNT